MAKKNKYTNTLILKQQFAEKKDKYDSLGVNIGLALNILLKEEELSVLNITTRTKDVDSFVEKIERKKYDLPFDQVEDICGVRIICYYQSEIASICEIIKREFEIIESIDKETSLNANEFGYRSFHFVIRIKEEWLSSPNYRNLKGLKAEIQIRTVLMHAWAEIEHKLAYKKLDDIPKQFTRQLSRISAKLEEADEQFEKLKNDVFEYRNNLIEKAVRNKRKLENNLELNLDNLQAFLDLNFQERVKDIKQTSDLLEDLREHNVTIDLLNQYYESSKTILDKIEEEESVLMGTTIKWGQSGAIRTLLDINDDNYFLKRKDIFPDYVLKPLEKYRKNLVR